jgi:hypothetical protein
MGTSAIEIPIERVDVCFRSSDRVMARLVPEIIGPYTETTTYADNKPYLSFSMFSILFKKQQRSGRFMTLHDWSPIMEAVKKGTVTFTLVTPPTISDIVLEPLDMVYNPNIDMFEFGGAIKKEVK